MRQLLPPILMALAIRMIVVYFCYRQLPDADQHYEQFGWEVGWVARALASGHGFSSAFFPMSGPTAMVSPLYTFLLSGVFRLFGIYSLTSAFVILSLNSLFSSLTCIPVYFSAEYSLGVRAARIAAWVWALYPFAIYFSAGRVWEYSLTSLLFTTCFCIAQRIHTSLKWSRVARLRPIVWGHGELKSSGTVDAAISLDPLSMESEQIGRPLDTLWSTHHRWCARRRHALDGAKLSRTPCTLPHPG